jgi:hypothetical protein
MLTSGFNYLTIKFISLCHYQMCPCKTFSLVLFSALLKKENSRSARIEFRTCGCGVGERY